MAINACGQSKPDRLRQSQHKAIETDRADWGHWGRNPGEYTQWTSHSNRLIPIYVFGTDLTDYKNERSVYRNKGRIRKLYGKLPRQTHNPSANYLDQTDVFRIQKKALADGKKYVFLIVFDGMDYETTRAAAIYKQRRNVYQQGRGRGLSFLDYRGTQTDYGYFVSSAHSDGTKHDVDAQVLSNPGGGEKRGGYSSQLGGSTPWDRTVNSNYLLGKQKDVPHVVTDSASSATSMNAGIKTYNGAINVDHEGNHVTPIAHEFQRRGYAIGAVTSVPISHATPAATYANNVTRNDYQDITRDLLGLRSSSHRTEPLEGLDVLIGAGWGKVNKDNRDEQGQNYVPGNRYLADADLNSIDVKNGGKYVVAQRTSGRPGRWLLADAAETAAQNRQRLFGFFGFASNPHLPYRTADGNYDPTRGTAEIDEYTTADIVENPTLAEMTAAALVALDARSEKGFWLMVEPGDVDWANHNNNIDDSIGAVLSGEAAFDVVMRWVEAKDAWDDTVVIVTADHGHYFELLRPDVLTGKAEVATEPAKGSDPVKTSSD
jgi:alkaline phosphatase